MRPSFGGLEVRYGCRQSEFGNRENLPLPVVYFHLDNRLDDDR